MTPDLEQIVETGVKSGRYHSASAMVQEALRLLEHRDEVFPMRRDDVRDQIEQGWQKARHGELVDGGEVFARQVALMERQGR